MSFKIQIVPAPGAQWEDLCPNGYRIPYLFATEQGASSFATPKFRMFRVVEYAQASLPACIEVFNSNPKNRDILSNLGRQILDELRILLYGDCDVARQIIVVAELMQHYDGVQAGQSNNLLALLQSLHKD